MRCAQQRRPRSCCTGNTGEKQFLQHMCDLTVSLKVTVIRLHSKAMWLRKASRVVAPLYEAPNLRQGVHMGGTPVA